MLFHSHPFLLLFLPVVLALYHIIPRREIRQWHLLAASLVFYASAEIRFLPLLIGSIAFNWCAAHLMRKQGSNWAFWPAIGGNLGLLGYFKYRDFFADNLFSLLDMPYEQASLILPIGISFFTFQQISYLADIAAKKTEPYPLREYALYVSFFPQLIAGPIVRHDELIWQFRSLPETRIDAVEMGKGLAFVCIGLFKKLILADSLAPHADSVFQAANNGLVPFADAWTGTLAFCFQIYFDFSAYSDMAVGLALMFGLQLPFNFDAPYRATSLSDFWRRWHMTLSRFFRDYLYIPLGGNQCGPVRQTANLVTAMTLCGFWHGAAWTFLIWGAFHGIGLAINHFARQHVKIPAPGGWLLTFLFVLLGWVIFRAETPDGLWSLYQSMVLFPADLASRVQVQAPYYALISAAAVAFLLPTSQRYILGRFVLPVPAAILSGLFFAYALLVIGAGQPEDFIYFQF